MEGEDDGQEEGLEEARLEIKQEEIQNMLNCGAVSKNLYDRLEVFTAPGPQFEHNLKPGCKSCPKCKLCMEQGGQTYLERSQTEAFKAHL